MDTLKTYLVEVALKKLGPAFIKGAFAWLFVYIGAHTGILNGMGITWDPSSHTMDIDFDILAGGVEKSFWLLTAGSGGLVAFMSGIQHHTVAAIKGQPQDGAHQRAGDPPKENI